MTKLLIVESPTKAKHIRHMLGSGWEVKATIGHIRDMPKSGDDSYVRPPEFKVHYEIQSSKADTVKELQRAAQSAESVFIATDPDREGEAIAWHVCQVLGIKPGIAKRVTYQEVTEPAIRKAIAAPRTVNMPLVAAQEARRALDRIVGWEVSGPLSNAIGSRASAGRVQTPALSLVVAREQAIRQFKPTPWFQVVAHVAGKDAAPAWRAVWVDGTQEGEYFQDNAYAKALADALPSMALKVTKAETKPVRKAPAPPFTTSSMQMDGARALKAPVDAIMKAAQSLFEHGHITYHRTDSPNLSEEGEGLLRAALKKENLPLVETPRRWKSKGGAQEAHEAIRPTRPMVRQAGENELEQALYDLIRKRALASQMPDAIYQQTSCTLDGGTFQGRPAVFRAVGSVLKDPGWMALYREMAEDDDSAENPAANPVPRLAVGDAARAARGECLSKTTKAPPRYTESTLIKALEDHGVGRPSTYASILKNLFAREYIRRKGKSPALYATDLGEKIVEALSVFDFSNVDYTREVEADLDRITEGQMRPRDLLAKSFADIQRILDTMPTQARGRPCPVEGCDGTVRRLESKRKPGVFFWMCSNRDAHPLLQDADGEPGAPFAERAETGDGPVCPECGAATSRQESRNGHGFFRCGKGHGSWWDDNGALGKKWEDRAPAQGGASGTARKNAASKASSTKKPVKGTRPKARSTIMD